MIKGDGIGDTPYVIDKANTGSYLLIAPVNIQAESISGINWP